MEFCEQAFGYYLHHHPHHGKDNKITDENLAFAFENETQKLYFEEFGEYIYAARPLPIRVIFKRFLNLSNLKKDFNLEGTVSENIRS